MVLVGLKTVTTKDVGGDRGHAAETRRDGVQPRRPVRRDREVLAPGALRPWADVVRAGLGVLDHEIGAVHEFGLDPHGGDQPE